MRVEFYPETKVCSGCGLDKPLEDYYQASDGGKYGRRSRCKMCMDTTNRRWRAENPDRIRAYSRTDYERHIEARRTDAAERTAAHPEQASAHTALICAVRKGEITRSATCEICGEKAKTQAHHDDYSKPLDVRWLCPSCHKKHHVALGKLA